MNGKLVRCEESIATVWGHERSVSEFVGDPEPFSGRAFKRINMKKRARSLEEFRSGVAGQLIHGGR